MYVARYSNLTVVIQDANNRHTVRNWDIIDFHKFFTTVNRT
jgi:hypothetical protein